MTKKIKKIIKICCDGTEYIDFHKLNLFQEDIKDISKENLEKLKDSLKQGIKAPQFVWKFEDKFYILDGTQRQTAFHSLESDGWIIPHVPVVQIYAKTKKEAKQTVLIFVSQHGTVNENKLHLYIKKYEIKMQNIVIRKEPLKLSIGNKEIKIKEKEIDILNTEHECPKCGYKW